MAPGSPSAREGDAGGRERPSRVRPARAAGAAPVATAILLAAAALATPAPLRAAGDPSERVRLDAPGRGAWQPLTFRNVERRTEYEPVSIGGTEAVRAHSDCSSSALVLPLDDLDLRATPRLRWRWRIDRAPDAADPETKEGDDYPARVYVLFPFEPERTGVWERLRRGIAERIYGERLPGSALNYVWTRRAPAGAVWDNPFTQRSKMISRGAHPLSRWKSEEADVLADYERLFGEPPPQPSGVALMTDSDGSCGEAVAFFADFRFLSRAADPDAVPGRPERTRGAAPRRAEEGSGPR